MEVLRRWFLGLVELLSDVRGDDEGGEGDAAVATKDEGSGDEGSGDEGEGDEGEGDEGEGAGDDSGKNVGKDRSQYIPRDRFDKVNAKAQKVEALLSAGVLTEDDEGNLRINPKALKDISGHKEEGSDKVNYRFTKDEVDENSWPLVEKINKAYDYYDNMGAKLSFMIAQLGSQLRTVGDYPEFIQKDSALKKRALEIFKNDPEFKKTYRGNPEALYWAVKRASELLSGQKPSSKPKKKPGFIIGRGDVGKGQSKTVDISKLSKEQLDDLERKEHERLEGLRKQGKR